MAAENPVESLKDEATCSICLDYFEDPVSIRCGHNFCRACITQYWRKSDTNFSCPQCRKIVQHRNFKPNRVLANVVEIAKQLSLQAAKDSGGERECEKHQEALKLFCEEDQNLICWICRDSWDHRAHTVVPIEEAAQNYKAHIQRQLEFLKQERDEVLDFKRSGEMKTQKLLKQTETQRQKIVSEFQQVRQLVEEKQRFLLAQLDEINKDILKRQNNYIAKITEEISRLDHLISELEGKCQQPASEFLQDIRSTLSGGRQRTFENPVNLSPEFKWGSWDFSEKTRILHNILKNFKETLVSEWRLDKENVTLDPDTGNPWLIVSEDQKGMRWQNPYNNFRVEDLSFLPVLGCEAFTSGRHYWEVELKEGGNVRLGVARESVKRMGKVSLKPKAGVWAIEQLGPYYQAFTSPITNLSLSRSPRKIGVYLDYEGGQVTFYDADTKALIFAFPPTSFTGQRIRPFFFLFGVNSQLRLCP
ncbi:zinc finger protein RFP-like [Terrapene carolina triunguis]|uniref:zinc finger protein RFP-like n=1 Tax=Terrapene triunguis TaxID=2587831 RepID=UPI000E77E0CB|nr:zinc finger protein RFP-like [Terrapene carolina triunguis]